jgi:hypothetical protein
LRQRFLLASSVAVVVLAWPSVAFADMVLPTVAVAMPGMILILIPVVVIEGIVLKRWLDLELRSALVVALQANLASTLAGLPIAWLVTALIQAGVASILPKSVASGLGALMSFTWIGNTDSGFLPTSLALLMMLAPFFLGSWFVEYLSARQLLQGVDRSRINRAVLVGNAMSYLLIAVVLIVMYFAGR